LVERVVTSVLCESATLPPRKQQRRIVDPLTSLIEKLLADYCKKQSWLK
jgi:hypothetical protein